MLGGLGWGPVAVLDQLALALDNLEAILTAAGMSLANVTRLALYATDVDAAPLAAANLSADLFSPQLRPIPPFRPTRRHRR